MLIVSPFKPVPNIIGSYKDNLWCKKCGSNIAAPFSSTCVACANKIDMMRNTEWAKVRDHLGNVTGIASNTGALPMYCNDSNTGGKVYKKPYVYSTPIMSEPSIMAEKPKTWVTVAVPPLEGLTVIIWGTLEGESDPDSHAGVYMSKDWWSIRTRGSDNRSLKINNPTHWMYMPSAPGESDESAITVTQPSVKQDKAQDFADHFKTLQNNGFGPKDDEADNFPTCTICHKNYTSVDMLGRCLNCRADEVPKSLWSGDSWILSNNTSITEKPPF